MVKPAKKSAKKSPAKKGKGASPKKGAKRAKKDPNAPKRGQSAYMFWLAANRAALTKPGMGVTDVAKAAGVAWHKVGAGEKSKFETKAAADKARYERENAAYKKKCGK